MKIRKCQEKDIEAVGSLYDKVVAWLDDTVNYPKWTYKVYPTERTARENTKALGYKAFRTDIVPENIPARRFYEKNGFTYAGEADLERGIEDIPVFGLLEKNWG